MRFEITYYAMSMTPRIHVLPEGTTRDMAIRLALQFKADPRMGFSRLRQVEEIDV